MKNANFGLCAIVALVCGFLLVTATPLNDGQRSLGLKRCTWGPSYWCSNISSAKDCHAVTHCIQTVWETKEVPVDNDSICQICKDMVTQARDQLRSNETMEELKEVFDGSCNLIPIKVVKKECCKLADDFVPELVEALSSQMNPDQVCSVAGLCNNVEIDKLLMTYYSGALDGTLKEEPSSEELASSVPESPKTDSTTAVKAGSLTCGGCNHVATLISDKFQNTNRDDILENILHLCGEMSSFSDACSNIVLTYFNDIYEHLKQNLLPAGICHVSGACSMKYHQHAEDVKEPEVDYAALAAQPGGDDIPCELCQQLVQHMRDLLVANTTETEFKQVLEGLCKQSKGFKDECLSIVDQYYDVIYKSLVNNLDANGACFLIGVCPKGDKPRFEGEIRPLLPVFPPAEIKVTIRKKLGANEPKFTESELAGMALPIDHLMGAANPGLLVENGQLCTLCEYLLHFIQETLATPATEDEIKKAVNGVCDSIPKSIRGECHNFVDMYGDAVIALLIQTMDPRAVCPLMQMCPPNHEKHDDMEVFDPAPIDSSDKPTCPLCLFAVEQLKQKIQNDKSKTNIKNALDHLCIHLPTKLQTECIDFVQTYSNELIDMLITDFTAQEICTTLKLCPASNNDLENLGISLENENDSSEEDFLLNEVDNDSNEMPVEITFAQHGLDDTPNCILCEELIKIAEKQINKHTTKEDIKRALEHSCSKLRKPLQNKCHHVVEKYGDKIADLLLKEMAPKMICRELGMCLWSEKEDLDIDEALKYDVIVMPNARVNILPSGRFTDLTTSVKEPPNCVLCEFIMTKLETELKNKKTQEEIKQAVESICNHMPKTVTKKCTTFVDQYANVIISLIGSVPPKEICQKMQMCSSVGADRAVGLDKAVTNDVIQCGVCHGAAVTLLPYFKQHLDVQSLTTQDMTVVACENLPAKFYQACSDMITIYGPSFMHLSQKSYMDEAHICAEIGQCYADEQSSLAFARISA